MDLNIENGKVKKTTDIKENGVKHRKGEAIKRTVLLKENGLRKWELIN